MEAVIIVLNIGRALMVCWALYSLVLIFFPAAIQRPSDPIGGAIQFVVAYSIGFCLDRALGFVKRRRAAVNDES